MKKSLIFTFVALIATLGTVSAQQNYAVLIAGNMQPDSQVIPLAEQWNGGIGAHPQHGFDEFWNDIYLQWEMLVIHKSYHNDNVIVLFGENGGDFSFTGQDIRYKADKYLLQSITDTDSKIGTITSTFTNLANTITKDDFLYVWIMSHGGTDGNGSYFYSYDNQKIYDSELATWISSIAAHKKVVVLSFPKSGGFIPVLEADDTIIITAGGAAQGASRADDMAPNGAFEENEIRNSIVYNHGEVNYHLVSSLTGYTPLEVTTYAGTDLSDADWILEDGYITIEEAYFWITNNITTAENPGYDNPFFTQFPWTILCDLEYPTLICWDIFSGWDVTLRGKIGISSGMYVEDAAILTMLDNSKIFLLNEYPDIWISDDAIIVIEDNVNISSFSPEFFIFILNDATSIGNDFVFTAPEYNESSIIQFDNENAEYSFHLSHFENANLIVKCDVLGVTSSTFVNTTWHVETNEVDIYGTIIESSTMDIYSADLFRVNNSSFTNQIFDPEELYPNVALTLSSCNSYAISDCNFEGYLLSAVQIFNSGSEYGLCDITNTNMIDNAQSSEENYLSAIRIYNSRAKFHGTNYIKGSDIGVEILNYSLVSLYGNRDAVYVNETQQVCNNNVYQIYAQYGAFPYEVRFNAIYGSNHNYLFYYDTEYEELPKDVSYNYWGTSFNPYTDLYPTSQFSWLPLWSLQTEDLQLEDDEELFYSAKLLADTGNFTQAKSTYRQVVTQYSGSKYATAALKELFAIESGADNDFAAHRSYYLSLISEQSPDELVKIADFLSNRCNIVLEDYQDAVEWYEAVIADPPSFPDSLFAIIDLGYLYLQMENSGLKSAVAATMPQYNPASKAEHSDYKDYLISLLYRKTNQEQPLVEGLNGEKIAMLYPNTPNPFTGSTAINYELAKDCRVMLRIYDHTGRTIKEVDQGYKAAGKHQQTIDLKSLCPGMYLCTLEANGIIADTQKLLKVE